MTSHNAMTSACTFNSCFRNEMKSAHSCTLSKELRHFSTCCVYFLNLGSFAYTDGIAVKVIKLVGVQFRSKHTS